MAFHAGAHPMTSALYDNAALSRSSSVSSKPKPPTMRTHSQTAVPLRVVSPSQNRRDSFDFSVPSLPPRLANFGRKISQMRDDFIDALDDAPDTNRKSFDSARESFVKPLSSVSGDHKHSEVPGMGDDPIMCPFCNKPLPPVLFHQPSPKKAVRPGMRRPATSVGVAAPFGQSSTAPTTRNNSVNLDPPKPLSSLSNSRSGTLLDAAEVKPRPKPLKHVTKAGLAAEIMRSPDPAVTSESLRPQVMDADKLNHAAAEINISEEDIRRWSTLAGVVLPPIERPSSAPPTTTTYDPSSPSPKVTKPAPDQGISPGGRFGFFRKTSAKSNLSPKDGDESDEDDLGAGSGYSKLLGAGSDDEGDETIHAEPKGMTDDEDTTKEDQKVDSPKDEPQASAPVQVPAAVEPAKGDHELRAVLQEVLIKVSEISKSHSALLTSQSTLLTSLKIARSNLAMAEANTEMLEAQIKQNTPRSAVGGPATPVTGSRVTSAPSVATSSGATTDKTTPKATEKAIPKAIDGVSSERTRARPTSLYTSLDSNNGEKSGWGFWNGGKKRLAGLSESMSQLSTPTGEKSGFDFMSSMASAGPYSVGLPPDTRYDRRSSEGRVPGKSASTDDLPGGIASGTGEPTTEIGRLRNAYSTAQTRMESMSKELVELKKGKVEMEAELENLSQALFEEANKMVADERRKRAEMEEALKEAKAEKDALRSTIMVLGGGAEDDAQSTVSSETTEPGSFEPRDLDKHYEALRRSIHHVADGTEGVVLSPTSPGVDKMPTLAEGTELASTSMGHSNSDPGFISSPDMSIDLPTARNSIDTKGLVEGSIPDIKAVASNPELEGAVDVPDPIPEDQPVPSRSFTESESPGQSTSEDEDSKAANRVVLDAEPNPWDDHTDTPRNGHKRTGSDEDEAEGSKGVDDLHRLMQKLKDEELGDTEP